MARFPRTKRELSDLVKGTAIKASVFVPAAAIWDSVLYDYTGLPLSQRAILAGATIAAGEALRKGDENIVRTAGGAAKRIGLYGGALALGTAAATYMLSDPSVTNACEMGALIGGTYGAWTAAKYLADRAADAVRYGTKRARKTVGAALLGGALLGGAMQLDYVNSGKLNVLGAQTEGYADIDESKLPSELTIKRDASGKYASYTLHKGENLYRNVTLDFTDFTEGEDAMPAMHVIRRRSGIDDVTKIPANAEIKIPLGMLSSRFYADNAAPKEVTPAAAPVTKIGAKGQRHIILDSGHGGYDPGSKIKGGGLISEDEVAYDIMVRAKKLFEEDGNVVHPLTYDQATGYEPQDKLVQSKDERVLVTPAYRTTDPKVAANLRLYKIAKTYNDLIAKGVPVEDITFISYHTNSLPSAQEGMMIYFPDAEFRKSSVKKSGKFYDSFEEVRDVGTVRFSGNKQRSEDLSYTLAEDLADAARENGVKVSPNQPVRGSIRRGGQTYLPLVLNGPVKTEILVESGNGAGNARDASRLLKANYRQRIAKSSVDAVHELYRGGQ